MAGNEREDGTAGIAVRNEIVWLLALGERAVTGAGRSRPVSAQRRPSPSKPGKALAAPAGVSRHAEWARVVRRGCAVTGGA